jgi:hypothetical protein
MSVAQFVNAVLVDSQTQLNKLSAQRTTPLTEQDVTEVVAQNMVFVPSSMQYAVLQGVCGNLYTQLHVDNDCMNTAMSAPSRSISARGSSPIPADESDIDTDEEIYTEAVIDEAVDMDIDVDHNQPEVPSYSQPEDLPLPNDLQPLTLVIRPGHNIPSFLMFGMMTLAVVGCTLALWT